MERVDQVAPVLRDSNRIDTVLINILISIKKDDVSYPSQCYVNFPCEKFTEEAKFGICTCNTE